MKRVAIYLRVSTEKQVQEGDSIPAQRDALRKYVQKHPDMIIVGEYLDDGVSGTRADRDELQRLLGDVEAGKVDLILVTKLDRLYRSIRHYLNMMDVLDRHNVGWQAIWENYDTTTPQGRLIINSMMNFAQFEAENTGQRIKQVFDYKKAKGEAVTGNVTPGYVIKDKHLVIDEEVAPAVRDLFKFYLECGRLYETTRHADPRLPKTKHGIKCLLKRRIYTGEAYGNPNYCDPIIDKELFEKVQLQLSRNIKQNQKSVYIFSGLVRCVECGVSMGGCNYGKGGKKVKAYRCPKHYSYQRVKMCDNKKVILESRLEDYLITNLEQLVRGVKFQAEAQKKPKEDNSKKRKAIEDKINRLTDLYVDDLITKEDYAKRKDDLLSQLSALEVPPEPPTSQILGFNPQEGINIYQILSDEEKRQFWRSIIRAIKIDKNGNIEVIFL